MPELTGGDQRFHDDRGAADPAVEAALAAFVGGTGSEHEALTALAGCRLLVPVVAVLAGQAQADSGDEDGAGGPGAAGCERAGDSTAVGDGGAAADGAVTHGAAEHGAATHGAVARGSEKASEMAVPTIVGNDGRLALPAFTSLAALSRWQPAGRPVPVPAVAVWQSAVQESAAVLIDIAGPTPIAIEGAQLAALAAGEPALRLHEDPDVWQLAAAVAGQHAPGIRVKLSPPPSGLDLAVELAPPAGVAGKVPDDVANSVGEALSARLADRARRGIAVVTHPATASKA